MCGPFVILLDPLPRAGGIRVLVANRVWQLPKLAGRRFRGVIVGSCEENDFFYSEFAVIYLLVGYTGSSRIRGR